MSLKLEIDGNYLVTTDSVTNEVKNYPTGSVKYQITDGFVTIFSDGQETSRKLTDLRDSSNATFTLTELNTFLRTNTGFNTAGATASSTGWGAYTDTNYTESSPLSLTGGASYVNLTNNAGSKLETQLPSDVTTFYNGTVITGRFGDGINVTLSFAVKPSTNNSTTVTVVPDIGGSVGEIEDYAVDILFTRGNGIEQRYLKAYDAYTYDTWEANGAQLKIKASHNCAIYNIRYLITRTHKAR